MAIVGRDDANALDSPADETMAGTERTKRAISPHAQNSSEVMSVIKKGKAQEAIRCWVEGPFKENSNLRISHHKFSTSPTKSRGRLSQAVRRCSSKLPLAHDGLEALANTHRNSRRDILVELAASMLPPVVSGGREMIKPLTELWSIGRHQHGSEGQTTQ